ncbi:MAG: hypothetical protein SGBAC_012788 [Bacillariaceae sp.]
MVEFVSPVLSEEERDRRREALRQKARAMIHSRPSSVLKDKLELQKLQEEMEKALAEEEAEEEEENAEPKPKKPEPLKIQVKLPNGELVDIKIAPDDTVPDIKEILEDDHEFPLDQQELFNKGKALVDMYVDLKDYGIETGDVLELNPPDIEIFVQAHDGKKLKMTVMPHISIDKLKQQIQDDHGIQADELKLEFNGESLNDLSATLTVDCGVNPGDAIDLKPADITVNMQLYTGQKLPVTLPPTTSVGDLKKQIQSAHDISADEQELEFDGKPLDNDLATLTVDCGIQNGAIIHMKPPDVTISIVNYNGKEWPLIVKPTFSVVEVKQMIQQTCEVPVETQELEFEGKALEDDSATLEKDYGIKAKSQIDLKPPDMTVFVTTDDGQKVPVTVKPTFTVGQLTQILQETHEIPIEKYNYLEFEGKTINPDAILEKDCKVGPDKVIDLKIKEIKISIVKHDGKKWSLTVKPTFSVGELKQMIQEKHEVAVEKQELEFEGKALDDDAAILAKDYGIEAKSKIDLKPLDMTVFVATHDGKKKKVTYKPTYSVGQLTQILQDKHDIPMEKHYLEFKGKTLDDPEAILEKDCKIKAEKTIDLRFKDITVSARDHGGETISISISPLGNIFDLQMKMQGGTMLALEDHFMLLDGKALPEDGTISLLDCGITDDAVIILDPRPVAIRVETTDGTTLEISISPKESVDALLDKIVQEHGIPVKEKNQSLYIGDDPLDDPSAVLEACGIQGGDLLYLDEPDIIFEVIVMPDGSASSVQMKPSDALYFLKKKIQDEHEIPFRSQGLAIQGKNDLSAINPDTSLEECGFEDGDVLVAESVPDIVMEIRINDTDGKKKKETMSIKVKHFYTVESLQLQLHQDFKIPRNEQVLKYEGKDLDDPFQTFKVLGIGGGSIIDLHPWHIFIKTEKEEMVPVVLSPDATVGDLQQKLATDHEIPIKRQALSKEGESIDTDPGASFEECGIKYGDTVDLKKLKKDKKMDDVVKSPKPKKRESALKSPKKSAKSKKRDSTIKSPKGKKRESAIKSPKGKKRDSVKSSKKEEE